MTLNKEVEPHTYPQSGSPSNESAVHANDTNVQSSQPSLALTRENIFWAGIAVFVAAFCIVGSTSILLIVATLVFAPLWIPLVVISSPVLLITSPVWLTTVCLVIFVTFSTVSFCLFAFAIFVFMMVPAKYLPPTEESKFAATFLRLRDRVTVALVKLQAKIVLYAAGVGPIADVAMTVLDRIDLHQLQDFVTRHDWQGMVENLQSTDPKEIPGAIVNLVRSILKL